MGEEEERREWGERWGFYGSAEFKVNNVLLKLSALNELVQLSHGVKTSHLNSFFYKVLELELHIF